MLKITEWRFQHEWRFQNVPITQEIIMECLSDVDKQMPNVLKL